MKTKEERTTLNEEVETVNRKLAELTDEELTQVTGGDSHCGVYVGEGQMLHVPSQTEN